MSVLRSCLSLAAALTSAGMPLAALAGSDAVPVAMLGVWSVSQSACAEGITPTFLEVRRDALGFYYGQAEIVEVVAIGPVVFLHGDLRQEGQVDPGPVTAFYRLEQRDGPDRLRFRIKDIAAVDLVRCMPG